MRCTLLSSKSAPRQLYTKIYSASRRPNPFYCIGVFLDASHAARDGAYVLRGYDAGRSATPDYWRAGRRLPRGLARVRPSGPRRRGPCGQRVEPGRRRSSAHRSHGRSAVEMLPRAGRRLPRGLARVRPSGPRRRGPGGQRVEPGRRRSSSHRPHGRSAVGWRLTAVAIISWPPRAMRRRWRRRLARHTHYTLRESPPES